MPVAVAIVARHFDVSVAAIDVRLSQTGLRQNPSRHDWSSQQTTHRYNRLATMTNACEVVA
jgi:hypothetical protein